LVKWNRKHGAGNVWAVMNGHEELGLIYMPTGSPSTDFYGGYRAGNNSYTSSLVAINATTGKPIWNLQVIHIIFGIMTWFVIQLSVQ